MLDIPLLNSLIQFEKDFDPILNGRRSFLLKREVSSEQSPSSIARAASTVLPEGEKLWGCQ